MFPVDPLVGKIEFAFGANLKADPNTWVYTDCTADWQPDRDLAATIGRADATSKAQPAKLSLWLKNPGGKYTKGNAMSPYWPYIRKNTPARVTLDPGTGHTRQYVMYVTQWIPRWGSGGKSGRQPLVQVVANGIRRRLTQGASPLRSPLNRAISALKPLAYWALEDGSTATQAASAIPGGVPLVATGAVKFAALDAPGADRAVDIANGRLSTVMLAGSNPNGYAVAVGVRATKADPTFIGHTNAFPVNWTLADGTVYAVAITNDYNGTTSTDSVQVGRLFDPGDGSANPLATATVPIYDGKWHSIVVLVTKTGPTSIKLDLIVDSAHVTTTASPHTFRPLGGPLSCPDPNTSGNTGSTNTNSLAISHLAFLETTSAPNLGAATQGYAGETVANRLARLGAEEGVPIVVSAGATTKMGPQRSAAFMEMLDECQEADGGILLDGLGPGFTYLARTDAYKLPVALTVDMAGQQFRAPFEPLDDDAAIVNDETVSRVNGSSARYVDDAGLAGVNAIERYDDSKTLNVDVDGVLRNHAAWHVHLGTAGADTYRFPGVGFDLHTAAGQALIEPWLQAGIRKRVQATHPPVEYGPGPIDLLVEGYTETVRSRRTWSIAANTSPYDPWRVAVVGQARVDSPRSTVRATVPAGANSLQVNVDGQPWTTKPAAFPFDLNIDGIRVTVTAITGTASPQTFTVNPATVTKQLVAGRPVRLWQPAVVALA